MKTCSRILSISAIFLLPFTFFLLHLHAQPPEKMSYQAVIRNVGGQLVTNQPVGMKISILQGEPDGAAVFVEIYNPNPVTNTNGLVTIEIGSGIPVTGTFSLINWSNGPYFLKTEIDPGGGTSYSITGTSMLLSVPYALFAETANNLSYEITENDPLFGAWDKDYNDLINLPDITDSINSKAVLITGDQSIEGQKYFSTSPLKSGNTFWISDTASNKGLFIRQDSSNSWISNKADFLGYGTVNNGWLNLIGEGGIRLRYGSDEGNGKVGLQVNSLGQVQIGGSTASNFMLNIIDTIDNSIDAVTEMLSLRSLTEDNSTYLQFKNIRKAEGTDGKDVSTRIQHKIATVNMGYIEFNSSYDSRDISFGTQGNERMRITRTGNIGIGTTDPLSQLHTTGSVRFESLAGSGTRTVIAGTDGTLSTTPSIYTIGLNNDLGGYIFYVTPDGKHGLVAATQDQSATALAWYATQDLINNPANHNTAGKNYTDWRLPSKSELNLMYNKKSDIGGFAIDVYWSSTWDNDFSLWVQIFDTSGTQGPNNVSNAARIRAIRSF